MATEYVIRNGRRIEVETLPSSRNTEETATRRPPYRLSPRMAEARTAARENKGAAGRCNLATSAARRLPQ